MKMGFRTPSFSESLKTHTTSGGFVWVKWIFLIIFWPIGICYLIYLIVKKFTPQAKQEKENLAQLQEIVLHTNPNAPLLPKKKIEAAVLLYVQEKMRMSEDCVRLINTTKAPDVFFSRLSLLRELTNDLVEVEPYYAGLEGASTQQNELSEKNESIINDFLDRFVIGVRESASELKTERGRINRCNTQIKLIDEYKSFMTPGNAAHFEELVSKLMSEDWAANKTLEVDEEQSSLATEDSFDYVEFDAKNNAAIELFNQKYNLNSIDGIKSIPSNNNSTPADSSISCPSNILQRKATEHKKNGNMDLAIACLRKSNEIMTRTGGSISYTRASYERLVTYLKAVRQFDEARKIQAEINVIFRGTRVQNLTEIMHETCHTNKEAKEYYDRVIAPEIERSFDQEQYDWICENLPDMAPKSFNGYRKMAHSKSENYLKLVQAASLSGHDLESAIAAGTNA